MQQSLTVRPRAVLTSLMIIKWCRVKPLTAWLKIHQSKETHNSVIKLYLINLKFFSIIFGGTYWNLRFVSSNSLCSEILYNLMEIDKTNETDEGVYMISEIAYGIENQHCLFMWVIKAWISLMPWTLAFYLLKMGNKRNYHSCAWTSCGVLW